MNQNWLSVIDRLVCHVRSRVIADFRRVDDRDGNWRKRASLTASRRTAQLCRRRHNRIISELTCMTARPRKPWY